MKTAIIWNEIESLKYAVIDGDLRKYHGIYGNMVEPEGFQPKGEFEDLSFQMSDDFEEIEFCTLDVFAEAIREGAYVIECGFIP